MIDVGNAKELWTIATDARVLVGGVVEVSAHHNVREKKTGMVEMKIIECNS